MTITNKVVSDEHLAGLMEREVELFKKRTPKSARIFLEAQDVLLNGVPMPWMSEWSTPHPISLLGFNCLYPSVSGEPRRSGDPVSQHDAGFAGDYG
jgi:hypothetical protein